MKAKGWILANYFLFFVISTFLSTFQSTLWLQVFGYFPPPHLWMLTLTYWIVYRSPSEGILLGYLITLLVAPLSALPFGLFLIINLLLVGSLHLLKQRIFWIGPTYFLLGSALLSFLFPIYHYIISQIFEQNPLTSMPIFDVVIQIPLTCLASFPLFFLFQWVDSVTHKLRPSEVGVANI